MLNKYVHDDHGGLDNELEKLAEQVVDATFKLHSTLGPGLIESVYENFLAHELHLRGLQVERQIVLPVTYEGMTLESVLRIDIMINKKLLIEIKAVETLLPVHKAQLKTYLKLTGLKLGLLINFNVPLIKDGIKRVILSTGSKE